MGNAGPRRGSGHARPDGMPRRWLRAERAPRRLLSEAVVCAYEHPNVMLKKWEESRADRIAIEQGW